MKAIQHDAQSLRHAAIRRYLSTRDRIQLRHKRRALTALLLVLVTATVLCAILMIRFYAN